MPNLQSCAALALLLAIGEVGAVHFTEGSAAAVSTSKPKKAQERPRGHTKAKSYHRKADNGAYNACSLQHWTAADGGASCTATCAAAMLTCVDSCLGTVDTEAKIQAIAQELGSPCNTSAPFGYGEFPKIDTYTKICTFRRKWTYLPTCEWPAHSTRSRFCPCGNTWYVGALGRSCSYVCARKPSPNACNEDLIRDMDSSEKMRQLASDLGRTCSTAEPLWSSQYPSINRNGQCEFTYGMATNQCDATTSSYEARFCPCVDPTATGDPHVVNVAGERFDILREGISTLLVFPRPTNSTGHDNGRIRVDASIEHPSTGTKCRGWFILRLWLRGSLIGEDIQLSTRGYNLTDPEALEIRIGKTTYRTREEIEKIATNGLYNLTFTDDRPGLDVVSSTRAKFANMTIGVAGIGLEILWSTGRKTPNALDFRASHLAQIGAEWGGLLGGDDHTWLSQSDPNCNETEHSETSVQLMAQEFDVPWTATATLD